MNCSCPYIFWFRGTPPSRAFGPSSGRWRRRAAFRSAAASSGDANARARARAPALGRRGRQSAARVAHRKRFLDGRVRGGPMPRAPGVRNAEGGARRGVVAGGGDRGAGAGARRGARGAHSSMARSVRRPQECRLTCGEARARRDLRRNQAIWGGGRAREMEWRSFGEVTDWVASLKKT